MKVSDTEDEMYGSADMGNCAHLLLPSLPNIAFRQCFPVRLNKTAEQEGLTRQQKADCSDLLSARKLSQRRLLSAFLNKHVKYLALVDFA